ncbi:MAG: hypothetical protein AB8A41_07530 [Prochlorococcus sp.]
MIELTVFALKLQEAMDSGEGRKQKVTTATGGGANKEKAPPSSGAFSSTGSPQLLNPFAAIKMTT